MDVLNILVDWKRNLEGSCNRKVMHEKYLKVELWFSTYFSKVHKYPFYWNYQRTSIWKTTFSSGMTKGQTDELLSCCSDKSIIFVAWRCLMCSLGPTLVMKRSLKKCMWDSMGLKLLFQDKKWCSSGPLGCHFNFHRQCHTTLTTAKFGIILLWHWIQ